MESQFLLKGFVIGFSIAAPVGPISVLCMRRTLDNGRKAGVVSGLGAATADAMYGCCAGLGLVAVSEVLLGYQVWLRLLGGVYLCCLGTSFFFRKPRKSVVMAESNSLGRAYTSTMLLTLSNPITILSFTAVFAGLGLSSPGEDFVSAVLLVLGVFGGSAAWWLVLSYSVGSFRKWVTDGMWYWINRVTGLIIISFGVLAFWSVIPHFSLHTKGG